MDLENEWNYGYTGTLYLGSDKQPIRAIFDTGSANSWILSVDAIQDSRKKDHFNPFDPTTSSTFKTIPNRGRVKIYFGSGDLSGSFAQDQVTIGNGGSFGLRQTLNVPDYMFGLVEEQSVFSGTFDAIVGMAYPTMAERGIKPFFDTLIDNGVLHDDVGNPSNVFAFYMSTNQKDQSELTLGGWNPERIVKNEEITWHDVVDQLFWSLRLDDIKVGGKSLGLCDHRECWMTPDSGTSQLCMPEWAYEKWLDTKWGKDYSCGEAGEQSRPELTFVIDGKDYSIPSHHWNQR